MDLQPSVFKNWRESSRTEFCMTWLICCWYYALVICNHGPRILGNSRDFDFWSSKSLLKAPLCGNCSLAKSLTAYYLFISRPFYYIKQTPGISPALPWRNFGHSPAHFHGFSPPSPKLPLHDASNEYHTNY